VPGNTRLADIDAMWLFYRQILENEFRSVSASHGAPWQFVRGGDALKAYKRWAGPVAKGTESAGLRGILEELLGNAAVVQRTSGYVVSGLSLKTQFTRRTLVRRARISSRSTPELQ
jgi:hypothetical protein